MSIPRKVIDAAVKRAGYMGRVTQKEIEDAYDSPFIIQRNEDGKYVALPGRKHSYTNRLQEARVFHSMSEAKREKCGNETILPLRQAFQ